MVQERTITEGDNAARYAVVFSGGIAEGREPAAVKQQVAKLLKKSADEVASLFNGKPHVIKRDANPETAEKIVKIFRQAGAICEAQQITTPALVEKPAEPVKAESEPEKIYRKAQNCVERSESQTATKHLERAKGMGNETAGKWLQWADHLGSKDQDERDKETAKLAIVFVVGFWVAMKLPDFDLMTGGILDHRSIVTHSFFLPLALYILSRIKNSEAYRMATVGAGLAIAIHLAFDLFPKGWHWGALIHVPFYGQTEFLFSVVWIGMTVFLCVFIAYMAMKRKLSQILTFPAAGVGFYYAAEKEPENIFWAGLTLAVVIGLVIWLGRIKWRTGIEQGKTPKGWIEADSESLRIQGQ